MIIFQLKAKHDTFTTYRNLFSESRDGQRFIKLHDVLTKDTLAYLLLLRNEKGTLHMPRCLLTNVIQDEGGALVKTKAQFARKHMDLF